MNRDSRGNVRVTNALGERDGTDDSAARAQTRVHPCAGEERTGFAVVVTCRDGDGFEEKSIGERPSLPFSESV